MKTQLPRHALFISSPSILVNPGDPNYDLHNALMPEKGRYVVLMFVDRARRNLEIECQIIDREGLEPLRVVSLTPEGTVWWKHFVLVFLDSVNKQN